MVFTNVWDDTFPADTQLANQLGQDLRSFRLDAQQRMAAISGLDAAKPNFASDAQPANWNGILFFATDTGKIYQFNNPSWTDVTAAFRGVATKYYDPNTVTIGAGLSGNLNSITIPGASLIGGSGPSNGNVIRVYASLVCQSKPSSGIAAVSLVFGGTVLAGANIPQNSQIGVTFISDIIITGAATQKATTTILLYPISGSLAQEVLINTVSPAIAISGSIVIKTQVTTALSNQSTSGTILVAEVI